MTDDISDEELRVVARHGSGPLVRALALVRLAKRYGREDALRTLVAEAVEDTEEGADR